MSGKTKNKYIEKSSLNVQSYNIHENKSNITIELKKYLLRQQKVTENLKYKLYI